MKRPALAVVAVLAASAAAPAGASAASIALSDAGAITYTAAPGEVNALELSRTVNGPFDMRMAFFEYSAPLRSGAGCGGSFPAICGQVDKAFAVNVALADEDDVASVNSFTQSMQVDAGEGSDDVLAGGIDASADGGDGSDTIVLAADNVTRGDGGSGRDRIAAGLGAAAAILSGGGSGDLLVPDGFDFDKAQGGSGDDWLVSFGGRQVALAGQAGSDVLAAPTGRSGIALDGGAGNDTILSRVGSVVVNAGSGSDAVDVRGGAGTAPDTVSCGSGFDFVWADAKDAVAADCDRVIRRGTPPASRRVEAAIGAAPKLLAHRPDPSGA